MNVNRSIFCRENNIHISSYNNKVKLKDNNSKMGVDS